MFCSFGFVRIQGDVICATIPCVEAGIIRCARVSVLLSLPGHHTARRTHWQLEGASEPLPPLSGLWHLLWPITLAWGYLTLAYPSWTSPQLGGLSPPFSGSPSLLGNNPCLCAKRGMLSTDRDLLGCGPALLSTH